jgi:DNA gyrase/topoisomerase IV subunit A
LTKYPISSVAKTEMLAFAQYTVASRAIPSMIDSLKPVQRFYLYSSLVNSKNDFKKVSAVAGIISDYGYNHGEVSASGAGQLMAATWSNNICLVQGRGSFGTRAVQTAGSARYVFTKIHPNFGKYVSDLELCPAHSDPEHTPPRYYLPILPLVLINGASGIATGFATKILPHSEEDIVRAITEYLKTGKITTEIRVSFPEFNGVTTYDAVTDRFVCQGIWRKVGKTTLLIEEIPYGFDREKYVEVLDGLEDTGDIIGYEDQTGAHGFRFKVNLKQQISAKWSNDEIVKNFKLAKTHAQNITVIDENDSLREYTTASDLVKDFVDFRKGILQNRIDLALLKNAELSRWLGVKIQFINGVLEDTILFKNKTKKAIIAQIYSVTDAIPEDASRLLSMRIDSLSLELVNDLCQEIEATVQERLYWSGTTPEKQYAEDIKGLK